MANRLIKLLEEKKDAADQFAKATVSEVAMLKVVRSFLPDYTERELINDLKEFKQINEKNNAELDLDQLADVAGGAPNFFQQAMDNLGFGGKRKKGRGLLGRLLGGRGR